MASQQQMFEDLLKNSDYFNDAVHTHRQGVAKVISAVAKAIAKNNPELLTDIKQSLQEAEINSGSPSLDSEVRLITREILFHLFPAPAKQAPRRVSRPSASE
jgi:hypothetical protein